MKSALNAPHLCNEEAAIEYVEARLWPDGPVCPHCGVIGEAARSKGKTTRPGLWNCRACDKPFTVKIGTVFESSHIPLHIWLQTIYLFSSSKKGISTRQLQRTFGGSMKTAWFLGHRVRAAMAELGLGEPGQLGGKNKVVGIGDSFAGHGWVNHSAEEYVRAYFWHTNTVENFFSMFKRSVFGCYFHVSEAHLHRYAAERDFMHNHRQKLGFDDAARADEILRGAQGKRLTYRYPGSVGTALAGRA